MEALQDLQDKKSATLQALQALRNKKSQTFQPLLALPNVISRTFRPAFLLQYLLAFAHCHPPCFQTTTPPSQFPLPTNTELKIRMFFFLKVAQNAPKSAKMKANTGSQLIFFDKNEYLGCRVKIFAYICALIAIDIPLKKDCLLPIYFRSNVWGKDQPPPIFQHKALLTKRKARVGRTSLRLFSPPFICLHLVSFPSAPPLDR